VTGFTPNVFRIQAPSYMQWPHATMYSAICPIIRNVNEAILAGGRASDALTSLCPMASLLACFGLVHCHQYKRLSSYFTRLTENTYR